MIRMKAPFMTGAAGQYLITGGICEVDEALAAELERPPHNFVRIKFEIQPEESQGLEALAAANAEQQAMVENIETVTTTGIEPPDLNAEAERLRQENEALKNSRKPVGRPRRVNP